MSQGANPIEATAELALPCRDTQSLSARFQVTPYLHFGPRWVGLRKRLCLAVSQRDWTSYAPSPFAWWNLGLSSQRVLVNVRQAKCVSQDCGCRGFHQPAWSLVLLTDCLWRRVPGSLILVVVDGKQFTVLFCVVLTWDQRWAAFLLKIVPAILEIFQE